jgi:hypothetical protein
MKRIVSVLVLIAMMLLTNNKKIKSYIAYYSEKTKEMFKKNFSGKTKEVK